jgi:hypothetical protein
MLLYIFIAGAFCNAIAENDAFNKYVESLPETDRQAARDRREKDRMEILRRRERQEMIEAIKPHNFFSFFGIGSK